MTRIEVERTCAALLAAYGDKHPRATGCLAKDRESVLGCYDFPEVHWPSIRTTSPAESSFAPVRLDAPNGRPLLAGTQSSS